MPTFPTLDQQRARKAYDAVSRIARQNPDSGDELTRKNNERARKNYGRACLRLPYLIHENGLCQTVAFYEAKGQKKPHFRSILTDLSLAMNHDPQLSSESLASRAREAPVSEYQLLTREAQASAVWFKRYAEAILKADLTETEDSGE